MSVINVTRSSLPDFEEYCAEIRSIWDSRWLTGMADKHQQLERELREYLGVSNLSLIANGDLEIKDLQLKKQVSSGELVENGGFEKKEFENRLIKKSY